MSASQIHLDAKPPAAESSDRLFGGRLTVYQSKAGYRFSLDALLLGYFAAPAERARVLELGTGSAVVALVLAYLHPTIALVGLELQPALAARARRSVRANGLDERIEIVTGDVRAPAESIAAGSFDLVLCNPPFRRATAGRVSTEAEKRIARHEIAATLKDFVAAAAHALRAKGRVAMIYGAERAVDLLDALRAAGIEPKRLRWVHSHAGGEATLVLVDGVKGGRSGVKVLPPLIVYRAQQEYGDEVAAMIAGEKIPRR